MCLQDPTSKLWTVQWKSFGSLELLCYVSYDTELKKKLLLWVSSQDLFEPLTTVMKVIPEVFSTSLVTDEFVRMVYWIYCKQMIYDLNRSGLSWIFFFSLVEKILLQSFIWSFNTDRYTESMCNTSTSAQQTFKFKLFLIQIFRF